jgi:hypothetical protein
MDGYGNNYRDYFTNPSSSSFPAARSEPYPEFPVTDEFGLYSQAPSPYASPSLSAPRSRLESLNLNSHTDFPNLDVFPNQKQL